MVCFFLGHFWAIPESFAFGFLCYFLGFSGFAPFFIGFFVIDVFFSFSWSRGLGNCYCSEWDGYLLAGLGYNVLVFFCVSILGV